MKRLELTGRIKTEKGNDIIDYHDKDFKEKIAKWKSKNSGSQINLTFEATDIKKHGQFKYYFGYLLPDICFLDGETDKEYYHRFTLKRQFLFQPVETFMEIPAKYRDKAVIYTQIKPVFDEQGEPVMTSDNEVKLKERIVGYAPSLADISNEERAEFINKCEMQFFTQQDGHIGVQTTNEIDLQRYQTQAKKFKDQGMGIESEDKSLFSEEVEGKLFDEHVKFED